MDHSHMLVEYDPVRASEIARSGTVREDNYSLTSSASGARQKPAVEVCAQACGRPIRSGLIRMREGEEA
jgi:hypothetical protein